jgi:cytoskeleton protein RodZ
VGLDPFNTGATLRQERLRQGITLETIAGRTRISRRFLQAIEDEDFARLPATIYMRNFVRQFAAALALDAEPLLAKLPRVDIDAAPLPSPIGLARSRYRDSYPASPLSTVIWFALAAGSSIAGYLYLNHAERTSSANVTMVVSAHTPANESPAPAASETAIHPVQVVLRARETSWVRIIADGKDAYTGLLNANDSRAIEADASIKVTAGNAGGLEILLNGKSLDPLGRSGQVRTVRLTAEGPQLPTKATQAPASAL